MRGPPARKGPGVFVLKDRPLALPAHVASIAPRDLAEARDLLSRVPARASAIEYRLDGSVEPVPPAALLALDPRPAIVTWRTSREGGHFDGSGEDYRRLVLAAHAAGAIVDVEHASGLAADGSFADPRRVIVSAHFPFGLPDDWESQLAAMRQTGALAVKLVAGTAHVSASLAVAEIARSHADGKTAIFPMGPASATGRILAALFGSALVYGAVGRPTAAGQPLLAELLDVYATDRPRRPDALFGIVAVDPASSLSPAVHNALFRSRHLPHLYLPFPVADFGREAPHETAFDPPFKGFSVTWPWKIAAARVGFPGEDVRATGAANTLVQERRRWRAENTDVDGVFDPLADHDTGEGRSAVILGTGGVARAAIVATKRLGYEVAVAGRRDSEADALAANFGVDSIAWRGVEETEADLYVNATPVGWRPDDPPAVPLRVLETRPLVFDCVYRRDGDETATIRAARAAGCRTVDGLEMFAVQAAAQARLFGVEGVTREEIGRILGEARAA
ncbi:MAG TPA: type I 3-dehydroquinate dehydratase [Thermoanaerobaculia bacterium]|nr:type I 3-dehydroquinate dehydratase [Thermoanaerobaculia bacterium]